MKTYISLNENSLSKIKAAIEKAKAEAEAAIEKAAIEKAEAALRAAKEALSALEEALSAQEEKLKHGVSAEEQKTANNRVITTKQALTKAVIKAGSAHAEVVIALPKVKATAQEEYDADNIKCVTDKTNTGYYLLMTARIASFAGLVIAAISELLVGLKIIAITFIGLSCSVSTSITGVLGLLGVCVPHIAAVLLAIACIAAICYLAYTVCSAKNTSCLIHDVESPTPGCSPE